jgi:hypothetical protein
MKRFALLALLISFTVMLYKFAEYCTDAGTWHEMRLK